MKVQAIDSDKVERLLSSKWTKVLFALSVAAFTAQQQNFADIISGSEVNLLKAVLTLTSIPAAFTLALFLERKYDVLSRVFKVKSKTSVLISLPIAIYTAIELAMAFHSTQIAKMLTPTSTNPFVVGLRDLLTEPFFTFCVYMVIALFSVVTLFVTFTLIYVVVSRAKGFISTVWRGAEQPERLYFIITVIALGVFACICYIISPVFWKYGGIFRLDSDRFTNPGIAQFLFEEDNRRLYIQLVNFPLTLIARILQRVFFFIPFMYAYTVQVFHIALMAIGGILMARMCKPDGSSKIWFLLLYIISYPFLLFAVPVEHFILSTFCVILCLYVAHLGTQLPPEVKTISTLAAAGTLSTSAVVIPFAAFSRNIRTWIKNLCRYAVYIIVILFFIGQLTVFTDLISNVSQDLEEYASGVTVWQKALQFIRFAGSCLIKPETVPHDYGRYILAIPESADWIGILVIVLSIISFIINRKNRFARISILWASLAFIVLFIVGWQSRYNEMFICSLYFGWAFFVLIFMFFEKLLTKLPDRLKNIKHFIFGSAFATMAVLNIGGMIDLVRFVAKQYPS